MSHVWTSHVTYGTQCVTHKNVRHMSHSVCHTRIYVTHAVWHIRMSTATARIVFKGTHSHHFAAHCNTLQHTATHPYTLQHTPTHSNTLQHTPTHSNTLQHTPTHICHMVHNVWHIRMCVTCHTMRDTSECILVWHIRMCNVTQNKNAFLHSRMCVTHQNACHTFCVTFLRVTWLRIYEGVAYERVMWHVKMYERVVSHVRTTYTWAYGGVVGVTEDRADMSYVFVTWRHMPVFMSRRMYRNVCDYTCHMSSWHVICLRACG